MLENLKENLPFTAILTAILVAAAVSRLIRTSALTAGLRQRLSARSPLLEQLIACPHCLCFWLALVCAILLYRTWLDFFIILLLGWRGAYYLNRLIDALSGKTSAASPQIEMEYMPRKRECQVCGKPWTSDFLERRGYYFCSLRCWFDYLKEQHQEAHRAKIEVFAPDGTLIKEDLYSGSFREITPAEAKELLDSGQGYVYLDVRSALEFDNGHPPGAVNVPLFHRRAGALAPNPDFLRVVEAHFPRDAKLLVGCQFGARSTPAAAALIAAGYTDVAVVRGGFGGARNLQGQIVARGWLESGLPVEQEAGDGQSYESLLKTKRK